MLMDFPANALTNFYVLHDFTDIAYAVCVVMNLENDGAKGSTPQSLTQAQGPTMTRLRKAELEIRKIGVLVSSDPIKHELFTFFRKTDLQRDGKAIFNRLLAVLRSNMCTISDKKAARASDILHLENARLYRLFMSALTPSIRSVVLNIKGLLPCGVATFITQSQKEENLESNSVQYSNEKTFRLLDLDPQLLASGHLILSFRQRRLVHLVQPKNLNETSQVEFRKHLEGLTDQLLVLAPSGQIARHASVNASAEADGEGQQLRNRAVPGGPSSLEFESRKREIWQAMVESWLANQGIELPSSDQDMWLDIDLPERTVAQLPVGAGSPTVASPESSVMWHTIRWPASLCFELPGTRPVTSASQTQEHGAEDPLSFAEDWFLGAQARAKSLEERRSSKLAKEEVDDQQMETETLFQNPMFASSPTFHRHALGDVSMSNNIYPTPPDGPVSQVTPGMSSIDGVVATPADQNQQFPEANHKQDDQDMPDAIDAQEGDLTVGTGQYDEDLFGDIPVDVFGPSGIADEPNWDFFDEPDVDIVAGELEPEIAGITDQSQNPTIGPYGSPELSSSALKVSNPSPMTENQQYVEQDKTQIEEPPPQVHLDSPKSENHLLHESHNMDSLVSAAFDQEQTSLTESDGTHVADTISSLRHSSKEINAESYHERKDGSFVDVAHAGRTKLFDKKYSANGRFWFGSGNDNLNKSPKPVSAVEIPKIGLPPLDLNCEIPTLSPDGLNDRILVDATGSESPLSAMQSDIDSSDFLSNPNESTTPSVHTNREWTKYAPPSPEQPKLSIDVQSDQEIRNEFEQLLDHLRIDDTKASSPTYERHNLESGAALGKNADAIVIAQILVDQLTQSSFQHSMFPLPKAESPPPIDCDMAKGLGEAYGTAEHVNLHQLTLVSCAGNDDGERISKLADTNISIYREGKPLIALPTILPFWEALGLQPAGGQKNITALCIHPRGSNVEDGCRVFIDRLRETYQNCNLGDHTSGRIAGTTNDGLVAWFAADNSLPDLSQTCERVGTALSRLSATDDTIMIYMVVPNEYETQVLAICEGFMTLLSTYVKTCGKKQPNELVLQLIPMPFVALPDTLAIPPESEYLTLAIEVYNRCPPSDIGDRIAWCGSAVSLADRMSSQVEFDFNSSAQSPFEKGGRYLHLAYSQSLEDRWITAAWTDNLGYTALTMSYCLRQKGSRVSRPVSEVIKDLWQISIDLMQKSHTKWRLVVAKEGCMTPTEINDWAVLANEDVVGGHSPRHTLVLLSIDAEPSLSLRLPSSITKHVQSGLTQQPSGLYGTPVSTPQASTTSPDQTTIATPTPGGTTLNAPTPPEHVFDPNAENDLSLCDPIENTWSVILSHGINQAKSILEARPALASGYLLKRRGSLDADNVVALEVNIVQTALTPPSERQELLRDILSKYKDLVTLARTRGMIDPINCVLPWHIATALRGQQALSLIM